MNSAFRFITGDHKALAFPLAVLFLLFILAPIFWDMGLPFALEFEQFFAVTFCILYVLRFKKRDDTRIIDYIKTISLLSYMLFPVVLYFVEIENNLPWKAWSTLGVPLLIAVYFYDRIIFNGEPMKKKFIVILTIQSILILLMLAFAFIQKTAADKAREEVLLAKDAAVEAMKQSERQFEEMQREIDSLKTSFAKK